jgi:hypothetical protein
MPESVLREELETLGIHVQGVLQLRSGRRDQVVARDRPLTPHFIVSVALGAETQLVRFLTELCILRVSVESYVAPKAPLQCKRSQRFSHRQRNCGYPPRCFLCEEAPFLGIAQPPSSSLNAASVGVTTQPIIGLLKVERSKSGACETGAA